MNKIANLYFENCTYLILINFRINKKTVCYMFSFRRKKIIDQNEESIQEIENLVQTLDKDGNGRIRIKDLENALQRMDEDNRSKSERSKQVRKFCE